RCRDVAGKGSVAADMPANMTTVHVHVRNLTRALEVEKQVSPAQVRIEVEPATIPTDAAPVAGRIVVRICRVPRVRQLNDRPLRVVELRGFRSRHVRADKTPAAVHGDAHALRTRI